MRQQKAAAEIRSAKETREMQDGTERTKAVGMGLVEPAVVADGDAVDASVLEVVDTHCLEENVRESQGNGLKNVQDANVVNNGGMRYSQV